MQQRHRSSTISTETRESIIIEQSLSEKLAFSSNEPYTIMTSPVASQDRIVVIDHGSCNMRVGFADAVIPTSIFPSVVSSHMTASEGSDQRSYFVGKPATQKANRRLSYTSGRVSNWEDMEAIWEHSFSNCLKVDTRTSKVFITEAANMLNQTRERIVETMFELFDVESTFLHLQPTLALFASGTTTGTVVDSGEYVTTVCPIYDGYIIPHACQRLPYGGAHITELLTRALIEKGYGPRFGEPTALHHLPTEKKLSIVKHIKEECAYVQPTTISRNSFLALKESDTFVALPGHSSSKSGITHILPDGYSVTLDSELYSCTEKMFQPYGFSQILSCETADITIHQTILKSILKCGVDSRKMLISNIVVAGGNSCFEGFRTRLRNELKAHAPNKALSASVGINPLSTSQTGNAVWLGGTIVCNLSTFEDRWITAEDYDEVGPNVVHLKCPSVSLF
jgi:actin